MASIGQSITGPRFVETDEVLSRLTLTFLTDNVIVVRPPKSAS